MSVSMTVTETTQLAERDTSREDVSGNWGLVVSVTRQGRHDVTYVVGMEWNGSFVGGPDQALSF